MLLRLVRTIIGLREWMFRVSNYIRDKLQRFCHKQIYPFFATAERKQCQHEGSYVLEAPKPLLQPRMHACSVNLNVI